MTAFPRSLALATGHPVPEAPGILESLPSQGMPGILTMFQQAEVVFDVTIARLRRLSPGRRNADASALLRSTCDECIRVFPSPFGGFRYGGLSILHMLFEHEHDSSSVQRGPDAQG